jgi:negative regulator of sigma E activity
VNRLNTPPHTNKSALDAMTEEINDQISAFIDDELSEQESAFLVRRFEHDEAAHERAVRYSVIGSALRGELLQPYPAVLRRRIVSALDGAPVPSTSRVSERWSTRLVRPLLGVGIAASVALVALVGLRSLNEARVGPASGVAPAPGLVVREVVSPPSYVVPPEVAEPNAIVSPIRLTNYLVHHGEYASRLSRTSVHSNVVGAAVDPTADDAVLEEAAIVIVPE